MHALPPKLLKTQMQGGFQILIHFPNIATCMLSHQSPPAVASRSGNAFSTCKKEAVEGWRWLEMGSLVWRIHTHYN